MGFGLPEHTADLLKRIPGSAWSPALDADGKVRDGAWVTELTGLLNLTRWPTGMRVIARVERPHPGAQLRITDHDGNRVTAGPTESGSWKLQATTILFWFSNSIGGCQPRALWRRRRLCQISRYSNIAWPARCGCSSAGG